MHKQVLICTSHYHPNVGGVETHLTDLTKSLTKRGWKVFVATYKPLARKIEAPFFEKSKNIKIYRLPWPANNIVHKLTNYPVLEFLYLIPGLFIINIYTLVKNPGISVIHSQGLAPGVVGIILGKIFKKRVIVSTHNLYFFPKANVYTKFSCWVFASANQVLTLSNQSAQELIRIGVPSDKISPFRYWLDLGLFKPNKNIPKSSVFSVFFVGRLIETKGVKELMSVAKMPKMKKVRFIFAGLGPLQNDLKILARKSKNVVYLGPLEPEKVKEQMNSATIVAVPSTVDEGFGRVAMEAIACGTPVLAANRGGLLEAVSPEVGVLVKPEKKSIAKVIGDLAKNKNKLRRLSKNTRAYALSNFSEKNVESIVQAYTG